MTQGGLRPIFSGASIIVTQLALCFLLFPAPTFGAFNRSAHKIPPPLPEYKWVGKTSLNYTTLHDEFVDVLICLKVPIGTFGVYYWFAVVLMDSSAMMRANVRKNREITGKGHFMMFILELFSVLINIAYASQNIITFIDCQGARGINVIDGITISLAIGSILSAFGGILAGLDHISHSNMPAVPLLCFGFCLKSIAGAALYPRIADVANISGKGLKVGVEPGASAVAILLCIIMAMISMVVIRLLSSHTQSVPAKLLIPFYAGSIVNALGNTLLGRMVGDPWGAYLVKTGWGAFSIVVAVGLTIADIVYTKYACQLPKKVLRIETAAETQTAEVIPFGA
ncbi:hypothetical protein DFH27DRAFT_645201 [Peziza echinospora]|nr:hypothetical protein DFH27DRAFT_645201 [Peziza echinospora]